MKKLVIPAVFAVLVAAVFLLLKYSVAPSPIRIMAPSVFEGPQAIGEAAYKRFYDPLSRASYAVFGIPPQPPFHVRVVEGFLAAAKAAGKGFDVALLEPGLPAPALPEGMVSEPLDFNGRDPQAIAERMKSLAAAGKRVFVYTVSLHSTHSLPSNAIKRVEAALGQRLFTITGGVLVVRPTHEHLVDPPCVGIARDANGTSALGCLMLNASRGYYRKKPPLDRFVAAMIQPSAADFLLLVSDPETAQRAQTNINPEPRAPMPVKPSEGPEGRTGSPVD